MHVDLEKRTAALSVGDFAGFALGPRESTGRGGLAGVWRAQLGTHWHNELRARAIAAYGSAATFEIPVVGQIFHRGWTLTLTGRIDQRIETGGACLLREIKSVVRPLPADESDLRADYPEYFIQAATYAALARFGALVPALGTDPASAPELEPSGATTHAKADAHDDAPTEDKVGTGATAGVTERARVVTRGGDSIKSALSTELVFVETSSGVAQNIVLSSADDYIFKAQLERLTEFLQLRQRARTRLQGLRFRPAFAVPRPGQETTLEELSTLFERRPLVLFEAPTGFGKTGVLLEFALGQLRSGHFDRAIYLTSKSTGQLQVVRTLAAMTAEAPPPKADLVAAPLGSSSIEPAGRGQRSSHGTAPPPDPTPLTTKPAGSARESAPAVALWHVRNKSEHCVNQTFHCVRDTCAYLAGGAERWPTSGLARFYLEENHARDLETLRAAGRHALVCPYEITRTALAFNDVWIGDYNYVFAPRNRGLFFDQPGFNPARTLLVLDEAHNLPTRVADAYSHAFTANAAASVREELHRVRAHAQLTLAWDHWCHFLHHLRPSEALTAADEDDARDLLKELAQRVRTLPPDLAALGAPAAEALWAVPSLVDELTKDTLPRLWWSPREGELALTCLDAAPAIGVTLREFGGVVLASATLTPIDGFAAACGLDAPPEVAPPPPAFAPTRLGNLNKRDTRQLFKQLRSGAELLRVDAAREMAGPAVLRAQTPWRDVSYDVAIDTRVETTFQKRSEHYTTTAATIAALHGSARSALDKNAPRPTPVELASSHEPAPKGSRLTTPLTPPTAAVAVFFPSYAYATAVMQAAATVVPHLKVALQPKLRDLAGQSAWVEDALLFSDAVFLVLGSSFAESIDTLGGRVTHAMVVGPALPEVNAVQRARLSEAARSGLSREATFRRVYQIPGMTKVNQALGRLVRAPAQRARVVLHCRRFLEPDYQALLAAEYQHGTQISDDEALSAWLRSPSNAPPDRVSTQRREDIDDLFSEGTA